MEIPTNFYNKARMRTDNKSHSVRQGPSLDKCTTFRLHNPGLGDAVLAAQPIPSLSASCNKEGYFPAQNSLNNPSISVRTNVCVMPACQSASDPRNLSQGSPLAFLRHSQPYQNRGFNPFYLLDKEHLQSFIAPPTLPAMSICTFWPSIDPLPALNLSFCSTCYQISHFGSSYTHYSPQSQSTLIQPLLNPGVNNSQPFPPLLEQDQNHTRGRSIATELPSLQRAISVDELLNDDHSSQLDVPSRQFSNPKIRYFRSSFDLLNRLFTNSQVSFEDFNLHEMDKLIILYVCRRKFPSLSIPIARDNHIDHEYFCSTIQKCRVELSNKRIEENIKFIFKHTMKYLKERFKEKRLKGRETQNGDEFYHHYFQQVVKNTGVPIEAFRDPLNSKRPKDRFMPKTLNSDYMQLLFRSREFARDFQEYVGSNRLIENYVKTIPSKFEKILIKWERFWEDRIDQRIFKEKLRDYFFKNKQCKLPWTVKEIVSAVSYYLNMIRGMNLIHE